MQAPNSQGFYLFMLKFWIGPRSGPRIYTRCIGVNPRTGVALWGPFYRQKDVKRKEKKRKKEQYKIKACITIIFSFVIPFVTENK